MAAAVAARSVLRSASTSIKQSMSRISTGAKPSSTGAAHSPFRIRTQKPQSHHIFRLPVEMSCVAVESLIPFHTATASALLTSMLSSAPYSFGWTIDGIFSNFLFLFIFIYLFKCLPYVMFSFFGCLNCC
ncbi:hypothetical protein LXL04_034510 [Taraxacum kok-saghyz]